jgi:hypothetical protein
MAIERAKHYQAKYDRICIYCAKAFKSKKEDGSVCYADLCQRRKESDRKKRQYAAKKKGANNG